MLPTFTKIAAQKMSLLNQPDHANRIRLFKIRGLPTFQSANHSDTNDIVYSNAF
jgi:hypothetical protein